MSTQNATLSDFCTEPDTSVEEDDEPEETPERPAWTPGNGSKATKQCENCEATVTPDYHRVHCDNSGQLHHCLNCVTQSDMYNGAGARPDFQARCPDTGGAIY